MNKHIRLAMLVASGVLFLAAATVVALYAVGYRFSPGAQQPIPVGVLLLETIPRGISVFINGTNVGTTPEAVSGLLQGDVHVRLEKEGYETWEKNLPIVATRATEIRTAKLFARQESATAIADGVTSYTLSPSRQLLAALDNENQLSIMTTEGVAVRPPVVPTAVPQGILWSPDSSAVLLQTKSSYFFVSTSGAASPREITALRGAGQVVWDPRLPGRLLGIAEDGTLISVSASTNAAQTLAQHVRLFAPTSRGIITVAASNEITYLTFQGGVQERREVAASNRIQSLVATPSGNVAFADSTNEVRIITRQGELLETTASGSIVGWSADGSMLLLQPGTSELAIINVENERATYLPSGQMHTIVRLLRPILHPQWFAGDTHVVFQSDDEILISEVDTRDRPIQFTVDSTNIGNAQATVGEDGFSLFYLKSNDSRISLVNRLLVLSEDQ